MTRFFSSLACSIESERTRKNIKINEIHICLCLFFFFNALFLPHVQLFLFFFSNASSIAIEHKFLCLFSYFHLFVFLMLEKLRIKFLKFAEIEEKLNLLQP